MTGKEAELWNIQDSLKLKGIAFMAKCQKEKINHKTTSLISEKEKAPSHYC